MVYVYLRNDATGQHLSGKGGVKEHVGDDGIWDLTNKAGGGFTLTCAAGSVTMDGTDAPSLRAAYGEKGVSMTLGVDNDGEPVNGDDPAVFTALTAPTRLPSDYVKEMNETGFSILDGIMQPDDIAELRAHAQEIKQGGGNQFRGAGGGNAPARKEPEEGRWGLDNNVALATSPIIGKCSFHPVALWVIQQYLGVPELCQSHIPSYTILKPAKKLLGERPPGGWHADYPYRPGRFTNDEWPEFPRLGVQYNICVDQFTGHNGATQFMPGSHLFKTAPTADWNANGTRMGVGVHKDVTQVEAPAGAAFIYDARVWHRACPELNESDADRVCILNSVLPSWVQPMSPRDEGAEMFQDSPARDILTPREVRDVERMCNFSYFGALQQYKQKAYSDPATKVETSSKL